MVAENALALFLLFIAYAFMFFCVNMRYQGATSRWIARVYCVALALVVIRMPLFDFMGPVVENFLFAACLSLAALGFFKTFTKHPIEKSRENKNQVDIP